MKHTIHLVLVFSLFCCQCKKDEEKVYVLTDKEKNFIPYAKGDLVRLNKNDELVDLFVVKEELMFVLDQGFGVLKIERKHVQLKDGDGEVEIDMNLYKYGDDLVILISFQDEVLDRSYEVTGFNIETNTAANDGHFSFSESETVNGNEYDNVYIFHDKGDTLYYTQNNGMIALKSDSVDYTFEYIKAD